MLARGEFQWGKKVVLICERGKILQRISIFQTSFQLFRHRWRLLQQFIRIRYLHLLRICTFCSRGQNRQYEREKAIKVKAKIESTRWVHVVISRTLLPVCVYKICKFTCIFELGHFRFNTRLIGRAKETRGEFMPSVYVNARQASHLFSVGRESAFQQENLSFHSASSVYVELHKSIIRLKHIYVRYKINLVGIL